MTREIPIIVLAIALAAVLVACVSGRGGATVASGQQPVGSDQGPATGDQRPAAGDQRPATGDQRPAAGDQSSRLLSTLLDGQGIRSWGVTTAVVDGWLEVRSGHAMPWPSVAVDHAADLSGCGTVAVDVMNPGPLPVEVSLRLDVAGAAGKQTRTRVLPLAPGAQGTLAVELDTAAVPGFDPAYLHLIPPGFGGPMDPAHVTGVVIFIDRPAQDFTYRVRDLRALPRSGPLFAPTRPCIDRYGQFALAEWPGKIHADADFAGRQAAEDADLMAHPAPADWDRWGGWASGPQLRASGRFRSEKVDGRWWLVDPDGRLFWSQGATCVGLLEDTPLDGREDWFADLPDVLAGHPDCRDTFAWLGANRPPYAGKKPKTFAFNQANLERKYGAGWHAAASDTAHRRFRSWGLNTFGNWSDAGYCAAKRTVYTVPLHPGLPPLPGTRVGDPYDPRFAAALKQVLERNAAALRDPWCLGFFVGNEIAWGDDAELARKALMAPAGQPAKQACIAALRSDYADIAALNAVWGSTHASWEALAAATADPGAAALPDLRRLTRKIAGTWFAACRTAITALDPDALFLGTRMHVWNPAVVAAAGESCDVLSFNLYRCDVAGFAAVAEMPDRPILVSEFHTGAEDRGLPRGGLVQSVATQAERAARYDLYVRSALAHPAIVGAHWFQYRDEPATGRKLDGEDFQIGFVDVADVPYPEMVAAARHLAAGLYRTRAGH